MDKTREGYKAGIVSIFTNLALFLIKLWAGMVTGSIAITADAWHTLSDSISSVVVIFSVKMSSRKPSRQHPFGYGRWEQIAAMFIGFLLAWIAFTFFRDSLAMFRNRIATEFGTLAIVVTVISLIGKEAMAQYSFYIGRRTGNVAVKADGWHHRSDALSSLIILAGIFLAGHFWWIDSVLGIIVSLMLFYAVYEVFKEAINKLLGEKPRPELIQSIKLLIEQSYDSSLHPHHFHIHNYVTHQELTFHIKLDNNLTINSGHQIATDIENKVREQFGIIATIHVEPHDFVHDSD